MSKDSQLTHERPGAIQIIELKSLRLQGCELTSSACKHLATALKQSPELKELDLSCNFIGDVDCPNATLETRAACIWPQLWRKTPTT
uniref:Uncharacterized protein n=1 Tax=Neogobius melanostomus TaxID=47308 RepID=A0A8C6SRB9_9GOBI